MEEIEPMIDDLTAPQRELHDLMSGLSEQAWSAAWMRDLEYELWRATQSPTGRVGRLQLRSAQCDQLRKLSELCGGWIAFDDQREEIFVPRAQWLAGYAVWAASH